MNGPHLLDSICPVPGELSRRAWEVAVDLGAEHSSSVGSPAAWHWLQSVVARDPEHITWSECGALFRAHRHYRPVRA